MHQALYRKYRPKCFSDVCGQEQITSVLRYEAEHSLFSHAYLFCGPRGTGKTSCAKILAKVINCTSPINGEPCGKCDACKSIDSGSATDVLEMDAASNTGVDYIRDIKNEVSYSPAYLKKRVYIIDEVHMLSVGAFNALLKTLEEPPEHVVFVLATTEFHKLPATVVSRCQRFDFKRIKYDIIAERLLYIADAEGLKLDADAARMIAKQALGGMRDAISLFELCSAGGYSVTAERVSEILGLTGIGQLYKTVTAVSKRDIASLFAIIGDIESSSKDIAVFWSELESFWRDMLAVKYLPENSRNSYFDMTEPEMKLLCDAARRFSSEALSYHFSLLDEAMKDMTRLPSTKRLTAELTLIKMSDSSLSSTNEALLSRISALEEKVSLLESGMVLNHTEHQNENSTADRADTSLSSVTDDRETQKETVVTDTSDDTVSETQASDDMIPISNPGDIIERVKLSNPACSGFLVGCDFAVSKSGDKVKITAPNDFTKNFLSDDKSFPSIHSALIMCQIMNAGGNVVMEVGKIEKKRPAMDELETF